MDIKLEEKATEGCSDTEYEAWVEFHTRREQNWYEIVRHLMQEDPSELTAVLFDGVDKIQHLCWRFIDGDEEGLADWERRVRHLCLQYFRCLDRLIEQICSLAGPEATAVIVSDHGFGPSREVFHVNSWLEKQGYLAWSENAAREPHQDAVLGVGRVARHTYLLDWSRTKAFVTTPTSNGIYITGSRNGASHNVSGAEYLSFREKLMTQLNEVRSPLTGRPVIDRIWTREELFSGPYMDLAPDLTLELVDGGLVSILESKQCVTERRAVAGTHRPLGVFMAGGPRILDLPIPESLEGHLPLEAFDQKTLQERPANLTSRINSPVIDPSRAEPALDPEAEAEIMRRLQDLGYLE
jgi:predicted AlkP superfamily phosphohydrolase/phosphomutase